MRVNLLRSGRLVERHEAVEEIIAGSIIIVAAGKVGEIVAER
jgi:hypothetical protein